jgi:hypothetical protein
MKKNKQKNINNNNNNNNNNSNSNENNNNNLFSFSNLKDILDLYKTYSNDYNFYTNHQKQLKLKKFENTKFSGEKILYLDHVEYKPFSKILYKQSPPNYPKYLKTLTEKKNKLNKIVDDPFLPKLIFHPKPKLKKFNKSLLFIDNKNLNINYEIENVNQNFFLSNRYLSHRNNNNNNNNNNNKLYGIFQTEIETRTNTEENNKNNNNNNNNENYINNNNNENENENDDDNTMKFLEKKTYYKSLKNPKFNFKNPVERAKHLKFITKFAEINLINKLKLYN